MLMRLTLGVTLLLAAALAQAQQDARFNAAAAFGARPSVIGLSLSPDGQHVAYIAPASERGAVLYTVGLEKGSAPKMVMSVNGRPDRFAGCGWVATDRLVCDMHGVTKAGAWDRLTAINADSTNVRVLGTQDVRGVGWQLFGGAFLDWLPDESGSVLMMHNHVPEDDGRKALGGLVGSSDEAGLGVDRINTRTLASTRVERPDRDVRAYISDGRGVVRIKGLSTTSSGPDMGAVHYIYRVQKSDEWKPLGDFNALTGEGFKPLAVDPDLNVAYGLKKKDGHNALYTVSLDGTAHEQLLYSRADGDIEGLIRIGARQRVVGASYLAGARQAEYLSADIQQVLGSLSKALHGAPLKIAGSSTDEGKLLVFAGSDSDPGVYYVFDRKAHRLDTFLVARDELEGVKLASVKAISYPADDGVMIPGYLTLPPGHEDAKGLPAIVLAHGSPDERDEWGFDWLSQFLANRGYAVLQPSFRGSGGYADAWFQQNGFHAWRTAVGDTLAAGHWLVSQGIAAPAKLGILGWSYGGYAALQSAVVEPGFFKAIIAIAPVTDLSAYKEEASHHGMTNPVLAQFAGDSAFMHEGSPIEQADKIKVPVLLFHGSLDSSVNISQSQHMSERLKCDLNTLDNLDHHLEDSAARSKLLSTSDTFLRQAFAK